MSDLTASPGSSGEPTSARARRGGRPARPAVSADKLFDRSPPHSLDAERSLLGSLLLDPAMLADVLTHVRRAEDFYSEAHGAIWTTIVDIYDRHQSGDTVQVTEGLKARDLLDRVGGEDYIFELAERVPSATNAAHYARIVAEKAQLRRLIDAAGSILYDAYHAGQGEAGEAREIIDRAEVAVFEVAQEQQTAEPEALAQLLDEQLKLIERAEQSGITGIETGYEDFDALTCGLQPGEMVILAARPSMGKTALALNMAEQVAFGGRTPWSPPTNRTVPVGVFSLEMSRGSLTQRLLSARSAIDASKLRSGQLNDKEWKRLSDAAEHLYEAPIYIDDTPGLTVLTLRAKARRMKSKYGIKALFVDYLQLLSAPSAQRDGRQNEVSLISRQIKSLARELNLPVVCLAQLNRGAEQREGNRPRMSDLRESGSIEQDADVVILLHREAYYHKDDEAWLNDPENAERLNLAELIIAKQRNGPTGVVRLVWDDRTVRFKNRDSHHRDSGYDDPRTARPPQPTQRQDAAFRHTPAPEPKPAGWPAPPPRPPSLGGAFGARPRTGPIDGHRDGGGPDALRSDRLDTPGGSPADEEPPF